MYEDLFQRRKKQSILDAAKDAATSGALTGGGLGAFSHLLSGKFSKAGLVRDALLGAGVYGGIGGGTSLVGSSIMGAPDDDDPTAFTRRGALGGAVAGGAAGAGLGALAGAGKFKFPVEEVGQFLGRLGPKKAALAGALGLGGLAGYLGSSEGMGVDFVNQEAQRRKREALLEAMNQ